MVAIATAAGGRLPRQLHGQACVSSVQQKPLVHHLPRLRGRLFRAKQGTGGGERAN